MALNPTIGISGAVIVLAKFLLFFGSYSPLSSCGGVIDTVPCCLVLFIIFIFPSCGGASLVRRWIAQLVVLAVPSDRAARVGKVGVAFHEEWLSPRSPLSLLQ